jgi:hypothetical protein
MPAGSQRWVGIVLRFSLVLWSVVAATAQAVFGISSTGSIPSARTADYQLSATALFMGGTGQPLIIPPNTPEFISAFVNGMYADFVAPTGLCTGGDPGCELIAVYTPEQLRPLIGNLTLDQSVAAGRTLLNNCIRGDECTATPSPYTTTVSTSLTDTSYVVFGQSQSAIIASYVKNDLIAHPVTDKTVSFVLLSNQNRPNGGVLERFVGAYIPIFGITFNGSTPTNSPQPTPLTTVDIAAQYDGWADFPTNPLNPFASANAVMGMFFMHGDVKAYSGAPQLQGHYQDTTYYLMPAELLPLVIPLSKLPIIGQPLARALDPPLRVLVEAGYDRTINPGQPTPAKYLYFPNPVQTLVDFAVAIPTGWDDAITSITGNPADRPFRTAPQPTYGVGGPPVYSGAVDPYGPVDPSVTVAETDVASAAVQSEEIRTDGRLAARAAAPRQGVKAGAEVTSSTSARPVRKPRLSPESAGGAAEQSQPNPSKARAPSARAA